jgi:diguanylate cyclase (GGDEF)-like protein/PAS domain S-box-containing protein
MDAPPTIGVLSPFVSGFYFGGIIRGVAGAVGEAGARLVAIQTSDPGVVYSDRPDTSPHPHAAAWAHLAGCIVVIDAATPAYLEAIRTSGKPVVLISKQIPGVACPTVQPDNKEGVKEAVRHLIWHGHTAIAFVGMMHQDDIRERYEAYVETLVEAGIEPDPTLVFATADNDESRGFLAGQAMLADGLRSTAVMVATDVNALGVMQALTAAGLELPRDQAIIGFDDVDAATFVKPALTSIRQDFGALGRLAAALLLDKLAGIEVADGQHEASTLFVIRESCGCTQDVGGAKSVRVKSSPAARRRRLEEQLDRTLTADTGAPGRPAIVAAAAASIVELLESAWKGDVTPPTAKLEGELEALYQRSPRNQTVRGVMAAARDFATELMAARAAAAGHVGVARAIGTGGPPQVAAQIIRLMLMLSAIHSQDQFNESAYFQNELNTQYAVAMDLLRSHEEDPRSLEWLERTAVRAGCLGLWSEAPGELAAGADPTLAIVGAFDREAGADPNRRGPGLDETVVASAFPPVQLLALADEAVDDVVFVLPVKVRSSDWGMLSIVGQIDSKVASGRETLNQWAALLTVALDHQANVASLEEQRQKVERSYVRERGLVEEIRLSEQRYALAAEAASGGLWDWDLVDDVVFYSARWIALLECPDDAIGNTSDDWFGRVHPDDLAGLLSAIEEHLVGRSTAVELEHRIRRGDGSYLWVLCRALVIRDADGGPIRMVGSLTDVHERKELESQLRRAALYDPLTNLPNRTLFLDRLRVTMTRASRHADHRFAVLFLDLDGFKLVNDSLGHLLGDTLLSSVAERILADLRPSDTASRFGGDEFAILLDDIVAPHNPVAVAERLQDRLARPFHVGGHEIFVTASIGIASSSTGYQSAEDVLRDADTAMYRAKATEKGTHAIFDSGMHTRAVSRLRVEAELRQAIDGGQLRLYYQPIVAIRTGHTLAFEALVRWEHPTRGLLGPADFLPIAEETGLIVPMGRWILKEACRQIAVWRRAGAPADLRVSVNVSNRQFWHRGLLEDVQQCLQEFDLEPRNIVLEITETVVMHNADLAERMLMDLHEAGFALHIDDFGTGYSSLQALHRFPIEALKVDRSFVWGLGSDPRSTELVRTIAMMARNLGVDVIAEGLETEDQRRRVERLGCTYGQGYLFSRPVPGDVAAAFVCGNQDGARQISVS